MPFIITNQPKDEIIEFYSSQQFSCLLKSCEFITIGLAGLFVGQLIRKHNQENS